MRREQGQINRFLIRPGSHRLGACPIRKGNRLSAGSKRLDGNAKSLSYQ
jgi:hypothetical protein